MAAIMAAGGLPWPAKMSTAASRSGRGFGSVGMSACEAQSQPPLASSQTTFVAIKPASKSAFLRAMTYAGDSTGSQLSL